MPVYVLKGKKEFYCYDDEEAQIVTWDFNANGYRLPSVAEWEWAAMGGIYSNEYTFAGSNELEEVGWYIDNAEEDSHPVGEKEANELGLYDMSGNVWEWCWDDESGKKNLCGGSYLESEERCTFASRALELPETEKNGIGFRLARGLKLVEEKIAKKKRAKKEKHIPNLNESDSEILINESNKKNDLFVTVEGGIVDGKSVSAFEISKLQVTIDSWRRVREWALANKFDMAPGSNGDFDYPVTFINWNDAVKWCNAKSIMDGLDPVYGLKGQEGYQCGGEHDTLVIIRPQKNGYRLPTELEWEWAARGGSKSYGYKF